MEETLYLPDSLNLQNYLYGWGGLIERGTVMGQSPGVPTLTPQRLRAMDTASPLDASIKALSLNT